MNILRDYRIAMANYMRALKHADHAMADAALVTLDELWLSLPDDDAAEVDRQMEAIKAGELTEEAFCRLALGPADQFAKAAAPVRPTFVFAATIRPRVRSKSSVRSASVARGQFTRQASVGHTLFA